MPGRVKTATRHRLARGLDAVRGALARRFLLKIKRATHRAPPRLIVPLARRVLIVAPHMDDEVIACGGTLLILADQGAELHVVYASDSSTGEPRAEAAAAISAVRRREAERVREFMSFTSATELPFRDGQLYKHEAALADSLAREIRRLEPDLIMCPFPGDAHSDHMSCASAVAIAARRARWDGSILAYEVWTPMWPNVAVDISRVAHRKEQAIQLYESQVADRDYAAAALGLNRFRGLVHSVTYAEAFFESRPAKFASIAALLDRL